MDATSFHAAIGRGDHRAAATWLVRSHAADVLSLCRAIVRDEGAAEDLAQDTFTNAFAGLAGLRLEASPRTWLLSIARNRCIDHLRRTRRSPYALANEPDHIEAHADDDAPLGLELLQRRDDVLRALSVLDEASRALVMLRFRHGLEYRELAEAFGQKEGTIRMRLSRALGRMRAELEQDVGGELLRDQPRLEEGAVDRSSVARGAPTPARPAVAATPRPVPSLPGAPTPLPPPLAAPPPPSAARPPPSAAPRAPAQAMSQRKRLDPFAIFRRRTAESALAGAALEPPLTHFGRALAAAEETPPLLLDRLVALAASL